jgi:UDPglucose 6-dehydrogenase
MVKERKLMKVTIIGKGWVGKAVKSLFPDAYVYSPSIGTKEEANKGDVAFIAVPSPCKGQGRLDTSIVEECIAWLECPLIVVRSTVNPGFCDAMAIKYKKHIVFQPEYLGETPQHPLLDQKACQFLIIGGFREDRRKLIDLYTTVYNANVKIRQMGTYEAEIVKVSENRAIAFKVAECQELYDACEKAGVDYYNVRDAVYGDDPRLNLWWSFIYPKQRGFNSKCIPKDVYAWCAWAESCGYHPKITRSILKRNRSWLNENI